MFNSFTPRTTPGGQPLVPTPVQGKRRRMPGPKKKPTRATNRPYSTAAAAPLGPAGAAGLPPYQPPTPTPAPPRRAPARRRKTSGR